MESRRISVRPARRSTRPGACNPPHEPPRRRGNENDVESKRFHLVTLGCAKNTVDSEAMATRLLEAGHQPAVAADDADLMVVHTCGFIESAKQESVDAILQVASAKRPGQRVIAAGCLAERYPQELAAEIPELDAILGARNWAAITDVVARLY